MYQDATELLMTLKNEYPDFSITTSGHSLGGALANVSSRKNDVNAVIFNPATLNTYNVVDSIMDRQSHYTSSMVTIVNEKDRISAAKLASSPLKYQGALFVLPERWHCILKCNHNISEVRSRLGIISQSKRAEKKVCESYNGLSKVI
ncbi:YqiA/YcfP family alpha/beta fold hydrolase [Vibrio sp. 99K-1]|uniref:YqiA/YcfP family alpha/beta fold hydrolase n=1 Tax=Vibrio sp. 99K-1 TaxID=2607603 RepID=UPI0014939589|nr:YqiA/YcfP family alpha/beta fold hydrolase [Vibrio sp. 99K-1]NOI85067.1 lipase family protein [Vibrio sp. 99K-1]